MDCTFLLENEGMSIYECSKRSGIPYSTLSDLFHGRTPMEKASFRTAFYLARTLGVSMEELYERTYVPERCSFETFKSQVRHDVKAIGDISYVDYVVESQAIKKYWHLEWFHEAFYMLAMLDYLCRVNNLETKEEYDYIREYKLPETAYPSDIVLAAKLSPDLDIRAEAVRQSIPEFIRFNIVEKEIRDVY